MISQAALGSPSLVSSTVITLVAWVLLAFQFIGVGWCFSVACVQSRANAESVLKKFWLGLAATLAWLQLWSLWLPTSWLAMLPLLAVAAVGWVMSRRAVGMRLRCLIRRPGAVLGVGALAIWAAITAQAPLTLYDAGFYHLQSLRWIATYPTVPGLGNLNPMLGIASSMFLYLDAVTVADIHGFHIGIALLLLVLLLDLVVRAMRQPRSLSSLVAMLMILPTCIFVGIAGLATTMYDAGSFILSLLMTLRLLEIVDRQQPSRSELLDSVLVVTALGFAAITIKIANAAFCAGCIVLLLWLALRRHGLRGRLMREVLVLISALGVVQLGPWLLRNVVLTGYPLYPLPILRVAGDWSMPDASVRAYRDLVSDFARVHGPDFVGASRNFDWLGGWLAISWRDGAVPLVLGVLAVTGVACAAPRLARRLGQRWLVLAVLWFGVLAWFFSAPDPRYAGALLWLVGAVPVAFWIRSVPRIAGILVGVVFIAAVEMPNASYLTDLLQLTGDVATNQFAGAADVPQVPLTMWTTSAGLQIYGPPAGTDQIWDAPLPASPWSPDPNLQQRCAESLQCGFTLQ
jgi:hypothetical protein